MKVPVYERQVSDAGAAKFRQNVIDTSAAQYNALRAQQYGEAQLIHGVTQFNNAIKQMSDDFQEAQVADKLAEGMRRKQEVMFADGTGLIHAQGSDAAGMADRAVAECKKIDEELTKGMSQWQMDRYKKASENVNSSFAGSAFRAESARMQEYREEKGKQLLSAGSAMFASGGSMEAQEDTLRQYCSTVGLALSDENLNKARRVMLAGGLDMVAAKDPVAACNMFEEIKSVFPEGDREVIRQKLDKAAKPVKAQIQAAELWKKYGEDVGASQDYIREHYKGTEQNAYMSAFDQLASDKIHALEKAEYDAWDKTIGLIESGNRAQAKQMIDNTPWRSQHKKYQLIDAYKDKFYPKPTQAQVRAATDAAIAGKIDNLIATGQFINNYPTKEAFLEEFGDGLSAKRAKHYLRMYDEGLKELTNEQIFSQIAQYCKVDARGNEEAWFKLRNRFDYELEQWRFEHGGKFPTTQEKIQIGLSMRDDVPVQSRSEIMGYKRAPKTVKRYEIPPGFVYDETVGKPVYKGPGGSVVIRYVK